MSELIERLNLIGLVNDEDRKVLDEAAARIRELEGMDAAHKQDRSDVVGTIGNALGLDETTTFSAVCMRAWDFIRLVTKFSGDEDPIALIEAATKLPKLGDGARAYPGRDVFVNTSHPDLKDAGVRDRGVVAATVEHDAEYGFDMGKAGTANWAACWCEEREQGGVTYLWVSLNCAYSTREAAEAAKGKA